MNLLLNGNIIGRAEQSKDIQAKATELERLELVKGDVAIDNKGKVTVDKYIEEAIKQGIASEDEVEDNGDGSKNIITDNGWNVNIAPDPENENNVIITIEGKENELPPRITKLTVTEKDATTAKITIEVKRAEGATYKYYCKENDDEYGEPFYIGTDLNREKAGVELGKDEYTIKVEATNQYGTKYKEVTIEEKETIAAAPKLTTGMIPVKWNGSNWEKTTESDSEWYSYTEVDKKWANVVLGEAKFITANGKEILNENEPYSQLVWIPRYAYKITNMYHYSEGDKVGNIKVKFINNVGTNTDSNGKIYSENYPTITGEGTAKGKMDNYVVHPAFNFGNAKLSGIWVGKYESSFQGAGTTDESGRSNDVNKVMMVKAGVSSWRRITISDMFDVCLNMNKLGNVYKLNASDNVVDPHLMKNDEWGACAYLSRSRYGIYKEKVRINNNSNYITGNGATTDNESSSTTVNAYHTINGQKASTTGNIYGVYDMNNVGRVETVAAYVNSGSSTIAYYGASLKTAVESANINQKKYVNRYYSTSEGKDKTNTQVADYEYANPSKATGDYKHYGDAVWETSGTYSGVNSWYSGTTNYPYCPGGDMATYAFFGRGFSNNPAYSNIFNFIGYIRERYQ